jgi:hypothetical protein
MYLRFKKVFWYTCEAPICLQKEPSNNQTHKHPHRNSICDAKVGIIDTSLLQSMSKVTAQKHIHNSYHEALLVP